MSGLTRDEPGMLTALQEYWGCVGILDTFGLTALDADGQGVVINAGLPGTVDVGGPMHAVWEQICVHVTAAHRLRRALATGTPSGPDGGEALIEAGTSKLAHATGEARDPTARECLRAAAISIDRARGELREEDPGAALAVWKGLVDGRWSLVDWFDSDGRRYMVARRNAPSVRDPRGLTPRERQVVAHTVLGESNKLIAYRLGLSQSTISATLNDALRKLGLSSRTQLVQMLALGREA
jgi:DNA-binding CsgD family transcriptional regulator